MSKVRADNYSNRLGTGAPNFPDGLNVDGNVSIAGTLTYQDVESVDSLGIVTARSGIQVLANGINAVGVVTATSFSGSGSGLTGVAPTVSGIASGSITNGQSVIIATDGKILPVGTTTAIIRSVGTAVTFAAQTQYTAPTFDSSNNKVVISFRDEAVSNTIHAIVGTVSGSSISFGTKVQVENTDATYINATFDSSNNKVVVVYRDAGNNNYGTAAVGTVSGTSISFGTPVVFETSASLNFGVCFDTSNNKVVISYQDGGDSNKGKSVVGTVSGTSISFGTIVTFASDATAYTHAVFDSNANRVVIGFRDTTDSNKGKAIVGTVSGTDISFGTEAEFESGNSLDITGAFDSTNNKVVFAYRDNGNSDYGTAVVGTVTGTAVTFGTPVVFHERYTGGGTNYISAAYDSFNDRVHIGFRDPNNSDGSSGGFVMGSVSSDTITFDTPTFFTNNATFFGSAFDSYNNKIVTTYTNNDINGAGQLNIISSTSDQTNLTSSNFLGFSNAAYTNGQTATIQVVGAVDDAQSGLTTGFKHFVQNDGTLSTTADDPSVEAGLALSATEILVR